MVKKIIHDPVFLSKKSVDATEADKQVVCSIHCVLILIIA